MKTNIRIYTELTDSLFYSSKDNSLFYHFTTDKNSFELLKKKNPLIKLINESEIKSLINEEDFKNNFIPDKLYECFGKEMVGFSKNLYEKFKIKTKEDIIKIKNLISNNNPSEEISVEFHRMKSTFATFGLERSRNLIEKKQKKNSIYILEDIWEVESSFESDVLALDNFYLNIEEN